MKKHSYIFEDTCYCLLRTNNAHPIAHERHDLIWYPETGLTLLNQVQYRPYVKSIVTECPWLIACYDRQHVYIWNDGQWQHPECQTYGTSVDIITSLLGITTSIPSMVFDGGKEMAQFQLDYEKTIPEL